MKDAFSKENSCFFTEKQCVSNYQPPDPNEDEELLLSFLDKARPADPFELIQDVAEYSEVLRADDDEVQQTLEFKPPKLLLNDL